MSNDIEQQTHEQLLQTALELRKANEDGYVVVRRLMAKVDELEARVERQKEFIAAQCMGNPDA